MYTRYCPVPPQFSSIHGRGESSKLDFRRIKCKMFAIAYYYPYHIVIGIMFAIAYYYPYHIVIGVMFAIAYYYPYHIVIGIVVKCPRHQVVHSK